MKARWAGWAAFAALLVWLHHYLLQGQLLAGRDLFRLSIPQSVVLRERLLAGELPLWISGARLGQPFLALLDTQVLYPPRVLLVLAFGAAWGVNLMLPLHSAIASIGAWRAARVLGVSRSASWVALAFGVTPLFIRLEQMLAAISSLAWSGWIVVAAVNLVRRPTARNAGWLAITFAIAALAGAPEALVWQAALAFAACLLVRGKRLKQLAPVAGSLAIAGLVICAAYLPAAELWRQWRAPVSVWAQTLDWSVSWPQLFSMALLYADRPIDPNFWGADQQLTSSLFVGALSVGLACFAGRRRWPLWSLALAMALLSAGSHLPPVGWLIQHTPLSVFRYPVKYAFAVSFLVALLGAFGAQRLGALIRRRKWPARRWTVAIAGWLLVSFASVAVLRQVGVRAGLPSGALWASLAVLLAMVVLFLARERLRRPAAALAMLAFAELAVAHVMVPLLATASPAELMAPSSLAARLKESGVERISIVLDRGEPAKGDPTEAAAESTRYVRESRENLVPLRFLEEHLEAVEGYGFRDPWPLVQALDGAPRGVYQALGVSHYLRAEAQPFEGLKELEGTRDVLVFEEPEPMPRAWVVQSARALDEAGALALLRAGPAELKKTVALDREVTAPACESQVKEVSRRDEDLELSVDACAPGFLVMNDAWFPGWIARVDGQKARVERADHLLRAVALDSGHHQVRLSYQPKSFEIGFGISVIGVGVLLRLFFGSKKRAKTR
ncbi:MAG: YfhO family protein [Myxococcaceae bacterium]